MNKAAPAIIAPIVGGLMFAAMGTTQSVNFDYTAAPEDRQKKYLDGLAVQFERDFKATAGKSAIIERIETDASIDVIAVDIRFNTEIVEAATADQIAEFRNYAYARHCAFAVEKALFDKGIALKIRVERPSGAALATLVISEESCAEDPPRS